MTVSTTNNHTPTVEPAARPAAEMGDTSQTRHCEPRKLARVAVMIGCLQALVVANFVQVAAGFAGADPSPPDAVVPGIAAAALLGIAAIPLVRAADRLGYQLGIVFCLASMVSMGPHKLFLDNGGVIAPLALVGFVFEIVFIVHAVRALRVDR